MLNETEAEWSTVFWQAPPPLPRDLRLVRQQPLQAAEGANAFAVDRALLTTPVGSFSLVVALQPGARAQMVPRLAQELESIVRQLHARQLSSHEVTPVFPCIATDLAHPDLLEECRARRIGVVDQTGTLVISAGPVFVHVRGEGPAPKPRARRHVAFSPAATRIARVLLATPERKWSVRDLSFASGCSLGTSQGVLGEYERQGWVSRESPRSGFELRNPAALLRSWIDSSESDWQLAEGFYAPSVQPEVLRDAHAKAAELGIRAVFTLASAVPEPEIFVSGLPHAIYCSGDTAPIVTAMRLKPITPHNFLILVPRRDADTEVGGIHFGSRATKIGPCVSAPQLIKDLWRGPGRGREQAEQLLGKYLSELPLKRSM